VESELYFADHIEALLAVGHIGAECESDTNPNEPFIRLVAAVTGAERGELPGREESDEQ
jgi:hypothetical protein